MKYIRVLVVLLFILSLGSYAGLRFYHELNMDKTAPDIMCDKDTIEVSVEDPEKNCLKVFLLWMIKMGILRRKLL